MLKHIAIALALATLLGCTTVRTDHKVTRIDATSVESAEKSYSKMMASRPAAARRQLALAVLVLNMEGVKSAHDVVGNPELQAPSIARIRKKVEGLSAEEIISLAARTSDVRIEPASR